MRVVRFAIFYLVNYLIENWTHCPAIFCHPSLPDLHSPTTHPLTASIKDKKEAGQLSTLVVSFSVLYLLY